MPIQLKSTSAKVREPQKVRAVLDAYDWRGVDIELKEEGARGDLVLTFEDSEPEFFDWPGALHLDQWPDERFPSGPEAHEDEPESGEDGQDALVQKWDDLYDEKGEEGFLALLRELAPYLETPLLILAASRFHFHASAQAWLVQPGAQEVETLDVHP